MTSLVHVKTVEVKYIESDGVRIFYREAGDPSAPVMLLIHGFPSSSHQYRQLIPILAKHYRVIAPDLPGFGFTEVPTERNYIYTFDNLAITLAAFVDTLQLRRFAMYVFDYGAPVGLRLALFNPQRITAVVSQNGNAYLEGLGEAWQPIRDYWKTPSPENRKVVHDNMLNLKATRWQYQHGVTDPSSVAPEGYLLDDLLMQRPGNKEIQLDLFLDYADNLTLYPRFQEFFRQTKLPTLVIWGQHDPFFISPGAKAFAKDNPNAVIELLDTGHFALETHVDYIGSRILEVLTEGESA
ncbi:alpha/beta hydrolase [Pseudomonas sp. ME-P-057]|uniref:alpha/beta fold hydrolase n=1 Tax=Pseudomonas sp. ME-P-057 TaxID=3040321 RepID=UPI002556FB89|nr:alpha/beta hydrolase [Pseudomonas sp. ME-P-057]